VLLIGAEAEFDESARIRRSLRLPAIIGLVFLHGFLRGIVPDPGGLAVEIMLADKGLLNLSRPLGIDFPLATGRFPMRFFLLLVG